MRGDRVKQEAIYDYLNDAARAEHERTLSEKIFRLSRDLADPNLSALQITLLRAELQIALSKLESLGYRLEKRRS